MTRRSPVPRIVPFMLLLPIVVVLGFAFSWAGSRAPIVRPHPPEIAYSHP